MIGANVKMDVYPITAGRMRSFLERVTYNVAGYVKGLPMNTTVWDHKWDDLVPTDLSSAYDALGPGSAGMHPRAGCSIGADGGMRTYYWDIKASCPAGDKNCMQCAATDSICIDENNYGFPQYVYDMKTLNCVELYLSAAFCAWDGGRIASFDELYKAYTRSGGSYPWGSADPAMVSFYNAQATMAYSWPPATNPGLDQNIFFIGIPGRRPMDKNPDGVFDLAGDVLFLASAAPDVSKDWHAPFWAGSWQGHPVPNATSSMTTMADFAWGVGGLGMAPATENQAYWAMGARCMR
jgi:hypothetical protein